MTEVQHVSETATGMRTGRNSSRFGSGSARRRFIAYALAMLMAAAMIIWIGALSWGLLALVRWAIDRLQVFLALL